LADRFALEIGRSQHSNLAAEFERLGHLRPAAAPAIWPASVPAGMPVMHIDRPPRCARLKASAAVQILPRAPDRVARLIYLDAFVPTNGRALIDFLS
jgi:hypothetical protein